MSNLAIFKMKFDAGRKGNLQGIFVEDKESVDYLVKEGIQVSFGEVLGKHSEVYGPVEDSEITMLSDNQDLVTLFRENGLYSGYNPFHYPPHGVDVSDMLNEYGECTVGDYIDKMLNLKNNVNIRYIDSVG